MTVLMLITAQVMEKLGCHIQTVTESESGQRPGSSLNLTCILILWMAPFRSAVLDSLI